MDNSKQFERQILAKNILIQKWPNSSHSVYYVLVFKQSQSGILYNERLLALEDSQFTIFYSKYVQPISMLLQKSKEGKQKIKEKIKMQDVQLKREENLIRIHYYSQNIKKQWLFKFYNVKLAEKWDSLFNQILNKNFIKSYKTKTTQESVNLSQFGSILSKNIKPYSFIPKDQYSQDIEEYQSKIKKISIQKINN